MRHGNDSFIGLIVLFICFLPFVIGFVAWFKNSWEEFENRQYNRKRKELSEKKYHEFLNHWISDIESKYRNDKSINWKYPIDWKIRRQCIFNRDEKRCQLCNIILAHRFVYSDNWENDLLKNDINCGLILKGGHVHHIKPVSEKINHELSNLVLLCESCHAKQEGHDLLKEQLFIRNNPWVRRNIYGGQVKISNKEYTCYKCEQLIAYMQEYYSANFGVDICMRCWNNSRRIITGF